MIVIHDVANGVGESPVWDDGVLRWVDITGRTVHALASDGTVSSHGTGGNEWPPAAQYIPVDRTLFVMRHDRTGRGDDDRGKRGGQAHFHQLWPAIAQMAEGVKEGRDQHDTAPHTQKPRNHTRKGTNHHQQGNHRQKGHHIGHGPTFTLYFTNA